MPDEYWSSFARELREREEARRRSVSEKWKKIHGKEKRCSKCGEPFEASGTQKTCGGCRVEVVPFDRKDAPQASGL